MEILGLLCIGIVGGLLAWVSLQPSDGMFWSFVKFYLLGFRIQHHQSQHWAGFIVMWKNQRIIDFDRTSWGFMATMLSKGLPLILDQTKYGKLQPPYVTPDGANFAQPLSQLGHGIPHKAGCLCPYCLGDLVNLDS